MTIERTVWIVGGPGEHLPKTEPRYHTRACYVLDQLPNRDRVRQVQLSQLPEEYEPCKICAPGVRRPPADGVNARAASQAAQPGTQVGSRVRLEYLATGKVSTVRLVAAREGSAGEITVHSPLGAALPGADVGDVVAFNAPVGQREVRVLDHHEDKSNRPVG